jgi:type IV pilus assembly protein PilA
MKAIRNSKGFTLIELLVVIAIIGILAAIAIPQFAVYRQKGFNAQSESDLRNAATAEEALVAGGGSYLPCTEADCATVVAPKLPGLKLSVLTKMSMTGNGAISFTGTSCNTSGDGTNYSWDSQLGGLKSPPLPPTSCP